MPLALEEIKSLKLLQQDYTYNKKNPLGTGGYGYVCSLDTKKFITVGAIKVIHLKPGDAGNEVSCFFYSLISLLLIIFLLIVFIFFL